MDGVHSNWEGKQTEFRRYLAGGGIAEAVIDLFRALRSGALRGSNGLDLVKEHFRNYEHPAADKSAALAEENAILRERIIVTESKLVEIRECMENESRKCISLKLAKLLPRQSSSEMSREEFLKCMLGPTVKKPPAQLQSLLPPQIEITKL